MSSVWDMNEKNKKQWNTKNNKYEDFPVGARVKIICVCQDFNFFEGNEDGVVTKNTGEYLGIVVKFDEPRHFEGGHIQYDFNFKPDDLYNMTV